MQWGSLPLAVVLLWAFPAQAQDAAKTYTLTVTNQDLQVLSAGLDELQRKVSEPVVEKLQKQLIPQMQTVAPPPAVDQSKVDPNMPPKVPQPANADAKAPSFDPKAHPSF